MGCDAAEGSYFSGPVSAEEFEEIIKKDHNKKK
jgi:EAL domain-containing protein (putative c-di-GMP-specific phosphodiesterase class I)